MEKINDLTFYTYIGLFITFLIIEWLGRKKTMAIEFFVFSIFVYMVNMCTSRLVFKISLENIVPHNIFTFSVQHANT